MNTIVDDNPWLICPKPRPHAKMRLFCLPFAGGGASMYHPWASAFPEDVEVFAFRLPGRESRMSEPRIKDIDTLIRQVTDNLSPYLDKPFAFFGYSMGALIAFEITREARRRGLALPDHLLLAAIKAPQVPRIHPPLTHLPDAEFIDKVRHYYGPSEDAWKIPELLALFIPILRDDMALTEFYQYADEPPLPCPIDVYTGSDDRGAPMASAEAWRQQTSNDFSITVFEGGHFFINDHLSELQSNVCRRITGS